MPNPYPSDGDRFNNRLMDDVEIFLDSIWPKHAPNRKLPEGFSLYVRRMAYEFAREAYERGVEEERRRIIKKAVRFVENIPEDSDPALYLTPQA